MALAIEMGADAEDVGLTAHPHPTLSETIAFSAEAFEGTLTDFTRPSGDSQRLAYAANRRPGPAVAAARRAAPARSSGSACSLARSCGTAVGPTPEARAGRMAARRGCSSPGRPDWPGMDLPDLGRPRAGAVQEQNHKGVGEQAHGDLRLTAVPALTARTAELIGIGS